VPERSQNAEVSPASVGAQQTAPPTLKRADRLGNTPVRPARTLAAETLTLENKPNAERRVPNVESRVMPPAAVARFARRCGRNLLDIGERAI
jgi:hypothetical protein